MKSSGLVTRCAAFASVISGIGTIQTWRTRYDKCGKIGMECAVLLTIIWGLSAGITFARVSLMEFYTRMNFPAQQLEIMKQLTLPQTSWIVMFCGIWGMVILGYLLYTRRYFAHS